MSSNALKQKLENIKDKSGKNLNQHLTNILTKLLLDNPKNVYDVFEDYATQIKLFKYDFKKHDDFVDNTQRLRETYDQQKQLNQLQIKKLQVIFILKNSIFNFSYFKIKNYSYFEIEIHELFVDRN